MSYREQAPVESRRPPRWLLRALILAAAVAMAAVLTWHVVSGLSSILMMLLCSLFVSLALEPAVEWLSRRHIGQRRIRRGLAAGLVMISAGVVIIAIVVLFGNLFVSQVSQLVDAIGAWLPQAAEWIDKTFGVKVDEQIAQFDWSKLGTLISKYGTDVVGAVVSVVGSVLNIVVSLLAMLLIVFYMLAQGPKMRQTICRPFPPSQQKMVIEMWEISQQKISGYINSRIALAGLSTFFTGIFLTIIGVPYWLALGVFVGVVSQFVPTVGTYIAGALPVIVALSSPDKGPLKAVAVLIFIIAYQQVENLLFSPKISSKAMDINPAVAFVSVLVFGAAMGPLGAFLSIPLAATIQGIMSTYIHRYELIDSTLLDSEAEDEPARRHTRHHRGGGTPDAELADEAPAEDSSERAEDPDAGPPAQG